MKQAIIIRQDLKMSTGKKIAQACHASLSSYRKAGLISRKAWELSGEKKVVLKVNSLKELRELELKARKQRVPHQMITDAGLTEVKPGTITCLGIGPARDELIDSITGHLKLL